MTLEAFRDIVWRILVGKGIDHKFVPAMPQDGMPLPKRELVFDAAVWDQLTQALAEAEKIWKEQVQKEAQVTQELLPTTE